MNDDSKVVVEGPPQNSPFVNITEYQTPAYTGKTSFPEFIGIDVDAAVTNIKSQVPPHFNVIKHPQDAIMTCDFRQNRIRVLYDPATNKVSRAPHVS